MWMEEKPDKFLKFVCLMGCGSKGKGKISLMKKVPSLIRKLFELVNLWVGNIHKENILV